MVLRLQVYQSAPYNFALHHDSKCYRDTRQLSGYSALVCSVNSILLRIATPFLVKRYSRQLDKETGLAKFF